MAQYEEPMDIDSSVCEFDNKENAYQHGNVLPKTPSTEKGYEELDVSELNMKLRYSVTPTASPMSRSYTIDNQTFDNNSVDIEGNLTRSLNSTVLKNDSVLKPQYTQPLQSISTDQGFNANRNALRPLDSTVALENIPVIITHEDDLSLPSSSSSTAHTPDVTTPTKDELKEEGSPIIRGLKTVLNMFRPSQSPISPEEEITALKPEVLSPPIVMSPVNTEERSLPVLASTPLSKNKDAFKKSSPQRESIVFNEDLERELEWKDDSTIIFSSEKIPVHKLFYQSGIKVESKTENTGTDIASAVEYMDISYNDSINKTLEGKPDVNKSEICDSDAEFVDCETTFTNNDQSELSFESQGTDTLNAVSVNENTPVQSKLNDTRETLNATASVKSGDLSIASTDTAKMDDSSSKIRSEVNNVVTSLIENAYKTDVSTMKPIKSSLPVTQFIDESVNALTSTIIETVSNKNETFDKNVFSVIDNAVNENVGVSSISQIPLICDPRVLLFNVPSEAPNVESTVSDKPLDVNLNAAPADIPLPDEDDIDKMSLNYEIVEEVKEPVIQIDTQSQNIEEIQHTTEKCNDENKVVLTDNSETKILPQIKTMKTKQPENGNLDTVQVAGEVAKVIESALSTVEQIVESKSSDTEPMDINNITVDVNTVYLNETNFIINAIEDVANELSSTHQRENISNTGNNQVADDSNIIEELQKTIEKLERKSEISITQGESSAETSLVKEELKPAETEVLAKEDNKTVTENIILVREDLKQAESEIVAKINDNVTVTDNIHLVKVELKPPETENLAKEEFKAAEIEAVAKKDDTVTDNIHLVKEELKPAETEAVANIADNETASGNIHMLKEDFKPAEIEYVAKVDDTVTDNIDLAKEDIKPTETDVLTDNIYLFKEESKPVETEVVAKIDGVSAKVNQDQTEVTIPLAIEKMNIQLEVDNTVPSETTANIPTEMIKPDEIETIGEVSTKVAVEPVTIPQRSENNILVSEITANIPTEMIKPVEKEIIGEASTEVAIKPVTIPQQSETKTEETNVPNSDAIEPSNADSKINENAVEIKQEMPAAHNNIKPIEILVSETTVPSFVNDKEKKIVGESVTEIQEIMSGTTENENKNLDEKPIEQLTVLKKEQALSMDEEIVVSENSSPFVSVSADFEETPISAPVENKLELNIPAAISIPNDTQESIFPVEIIKEVRISPPGSPKIVSRGYSLNFDEIEDPFATKTKIRCTPPLDTFDQTVIQSIDSEAVSKQFSNKNPNKERRKSQQPPRRKPANNKKLNTSFCGPLKETVRKSVVDKENENLNKKSEPIIEESKPMDCKTDCTVDDTVVKDITYTDIATEDPSAIKVIKYSSVTSQETVEKLHPMAPEMITADIRGQVDLKEASSSNKSTNNLAGASYIDRIESKSSYNIPEINDDSFNPFVSKSKVRQSPPPSRNNSFAIETKNTELDTSVVAAALKAVSDINSTLIISPRKENVSNDANNSTCSSKNTDKVNTEDEDTIEGPFLEAEDVSMESKDFEQQEHHVLDTDAKMLDLNDDHTEIMQFSDQPADNENPDAGELFIDAEAFEFLLNQNQNAAVADSGRESLFLKFDPLFSKRVSSEGVAAALKEIKKRQSTPKKVLSTPNDATFIALSPAPGPSRLNTTEDLDTHDTTDESFDDLNITVTKPMMVVNPAVNPVVTPRNKIMTPVSSNRRSLTFTSPAIAVIDRLLSLSANNSAIAHETTLVDAAREQNEADVALTQLRELLADKEINVYNLRTESKVLKERLSGMETQLKSLETVSEERLKKINDLTAKLNEKTKINKNMALVVEEYERTIASLITEKEQDKKRHAEERMQLIQERDEQSAHLASMEVSFSDLHSKYEKSKQIILGFKSTEELYTKSIKEFEENLSKMQNNYELLKQHATSKLNHANEELQKINRAHEADVLKLTAMIKRKDLHITSLEETVAQKTKANEELTAICDELINKVSSR